MISDIVSTTSRWVSSLPPFARRALHPYQMDFDSALSQMYSLCVKPSLVSKMSRARSMTKDHYYRDDPAFLVLQILFIVVTVMAYSFAYNSSVVSTTYNVLYEVIINYLLAGVAFASIEWVIVNRYMMGNAPPGDMMREVEWQYSFDIHCNGYLTYFMWTQVLQYVLLLVISHEYSFKSQILANLIYLMGYSTYVYNVFLGYLELPFLVQQQRLMYPVPFFVGLFVIVTLFTDYNCTVETLRSAKY